MSFSIESTRYCNYSKTDKFGEMKFVDPCWDADNAIFLDTLKGIEQNYNLLIEAGWQPQQAAEILPQCTAADIVMSGFVSDFEFIFRLRTSYIHETGQPHPLVAEIMDPLYDEFVNRNYINKLV